MSQSICWYPSEHALAHNVDGQIVLILLGKNVCTYLNPAASAMWTRMGAGESEAAIAEQFAAACGIPAEQALQDAARFFGELKDLGFIAPEAAAHADEADPLEPIAFPPEYEAPAVAPSEELVAMGGCLRSDDFMCGVGGIRSA